MADIKGFHMLKPSNNKWEGFPSISKFCFIFTLRQGVIIVALTEMALTGFALIILVLCAERAEEIVMDAMADTAQDGPNFMPLSRWQFVYNGNHQLPKGLKMGAMMLLVMYITVALTTIHLLTCMLLLYGTLKEIASFLLPWLSTVMFTMFFSSLLLIALLFIPYDGCKAQVYAISSLVMSTQMHSWLVVHGYYKEAVNKNAARIANNQLFAYKYEWGASQYSPIPTKPIA